MVAHHSTIATVGPSERVIVRKRSRESERQRVPAPLLRRRIASGRGAMEQPNVTDEGEARLTPLFWLAVVVTGVAAGLFGDLLMWILAQFERLAYDFRGGNLAHAVSAASSRRRFDWLMVASVLGALSWYLIRRFLKKENSDVEEAVWNGDGHLSFRRSAATSVVSEMVIGLGASIGREAAPKLMGSASASVASHWLHLSGAQRRLLVACGGGAGLAAVYNVPLGGAIFTAEVLYGSFALPIVLPALATSMVATIVAWLYLPNTAFYTNIPAYRVSGSLMVWSVIAGVLIGLLAVVYVRLIGWASHFRARGVHIFWAMPVAFAALGLLGNWHPQLFGNGAGAARQAFVGVGGLGLFFVLFALKPLVTSLMLASGASGGVFTPFLATGALFGAFLGSVWSHLWPGTPVGAFALVGAAAMIGACMQAPLAGLVLVVELTSNGFALAIPMLAATVIATYFVRQIDGYSIYSARLVKRPPDRDARGLEGT